MRHPLQVLDDIGAQAIHDSHLAIPGLSKLPIKSTHLAELDNIAVRHFQATKAPALAISGRHAALVYKIVSNLVSPPHEFTLLVVDLDGRFDATRLSCTEEDAQHVYVQRHGRTHASPSLHPEGDPTQDDLAPDMSELSRQQLLVDADNFMLYSAAAAASANRQRWGTIFVGGLGPGDIVTGWKGWLRVDREEVRGFPLGSSVQGALDRREARQEAVHSTGWSTDSLWGGFTFQEEG